MKTQKLTPKPAYSAGLGVTKPPGGGLFSWEGGRLTPGESPGVEPGWEELFEESPAAPIRPQRGSLRWKLEE